ncbi:MAG: hypothetical protein K1Y36_24050 [Blastocatellia bacterium]|nr:hypothetical protein [Blastocatellia bacterium]
MQNLLWGGMTACALGGLACTSPPVEETVTVGVPNRNSKPETVWTKEPKFPNQNREIEEAGDSLAKVVTLLRNKQNEDAQKTLSKASEQIKKVVLKCTYDEATCKKLKAILLEVQAADKTLQRGSPAEAIKQLSAVNKQLDDIDLDPQEEFPAPSPDGFSGEQG